MLKREIKYKDWNGVEQTGVFYFHITEPEIFDLMAELGLLEAQTEADMKALLQIIVETKEHVKLLEIFKKVVLMSYGEKSEDGKHFRKTEEIRQNFSFTNAYNALYMELATNDNSAADFMRGIMPVEQQKDQDKPAGPPQSQTTAPAAIPTST